MFNNSSYQLDRLDRQTIILDIVKANGASVDKINFSVELMESLNILISNDDGVFAEGIRALAKSALKKGHKVTVVCPDQERSATGHGLTLQSPLRVERADELFDKGIKALGCSGTPADCVKLALSELLDKKPDLVLSGINHGPNLGTDIFCSGTVAAAMEGTLENIPSMAISVASFKWKNFEFAS